MKRLRSGFGGCRVCFGGGRDRLEIGLEKTDEKGDELWRIGRRVEKDGSKEKDVHHVLSMWLVTWFTQEMSASMNWVRYLAEAGAANA
jgi:hypothetical protein